MHLLNPTRVTRVVHVTGSLVKLNLRTGTTMVLLHGTVWTVGTTLSLIVSTSEIGDSTGTQSVDTLCLKRGV